MAGGIDWFRWHHGSVTDPKFQLIARRSGQELGNVIAVWAFVLETASAAQERGIAGDLDVEAIDCMLNMPGGATEAILQAMRDRGLLDDHWHVVKWHQRQPKREDDTAAERKRRQREREHELAMAASVTEPESRNVTQCHADVTHGHDRGEERREEITPTPRKRGVTPLCPEGVSETVWSDWLALRKAKRAPVTATVVASAVSEADKAGISLEAFLRVWCARGSQGLEAAWLKPHERASPAVNDEPEWRREQRERTEAFLGPYAKRKDPNVIDMEAPNGVAKIVG